MRSDNHETTRIPENRDWGLGRLWGSQSGAAFGLRRHAPSNRINVGIVGLGNQSQVDLPAFLEQDDVQIVAVCDVNTASHGYLTPKQFLGRKPGQDAVNAYYAEEDQRRPL